MQSVNKSLRDGQNVDEILMVHRRLLRPWSDPQRHHDRSTWIMLMTNVCQRAQLTEFAGFAAFRLTCIAGFQLEISSTYRIRCWQRFQLCMSFHLSWTICPIRLVNYSAP